jgi:hypothetical protein
MNFHHQKEVERTRAFFEEHFPRLSTTYQRPFPETWCRRGSAFLGYRTGMLLVDGFFTLPGKTIPYDHTMNFDEASGLFVDITMDQFGAYPEVYVGPQPDEFTVTQRIRIPSDNRSFDNANSLYEAYLSRED